MLRTLIDDTVVNLKAGARLALLLPVASSAFRLSLAQISLLVSLDLALDLVIGWARTADTGGAAYSSMLLTLAATPIHIASCWMIANLLRRPDTIDKLLVAFSAAGLVETAVLSLEEVVPRVVLHGTTQPDWLLLIVTLWQIAIVFRVLALTYSGRPLKGAVLVGAYALANGLPLMALGIGIFGWPTCSVPAQ